MNVKISRFPIYKGELGYHILSVPLIILYSECNDVSPYAWDSAIVDTYKFFFPRWSFVSFMIVLIVHSVTIVWYTLPWLRWVPWHIAGERRRKNASTIAVILGRRDHYNYYAFACYFTPLFMHRLACMAFRVHSC